MLKQQARLIAGSVFIADLCLVALAFIAAHGLRSGVLPALTPEWFPRSLYSFDRYLPMMPLALIVWAFALQATGRYRSHRTVPLLREGTAIVRVTALATLLLLLFLFVFRFDALLLEGDRVSRTFITLFAVLSCVFLLSEKIALRITSRWVRSRGFNYRTLLIVGTRDTARQLAKAIEDHQDWGFQVLGFVSTPTDVRRRAAGKEPPPPEPHLGDIDDLTQIVDNNVIDDVFFAVSPRELAETEEHFLELQERGIQTRVALSSMPHGAAQIELEELEGVQMLTFSRTPSNALLMLIKRTFDIGLSSLLLLLGLPVVGMVAALIRLSSTGSVLYTQTRCGLNGRRFKLYKFRTMVEDAHERRQEVMHLNEMKGPAFKMRRDPRVTRLGRVLRKFSLDEVPQLWNVLRGDMSLVGPRPPIPEEVAEYKHWQRRRLSMKPGLTCLWQISGRNDVDFDRWIELDLEYIDSWSPTLDFKILLKTIPVVLSGRGAS